MSINDASVSRIIDIIKKKSKIKIGGDDEQTQFIRSGIYSIDWVMHNKGIPVGKLTEVYGDYSSGKSWFCYNILGKAQKEGFVSLLLDTEGSFSSEWGKKCGIDMDKLILLKPFSIEEVFETLFGTLKELKDEKLVIVWDSLAMTPSEKEMDDGFDKRDLTKAQAIGQGLRMILRYMEEKNATFIVINQLREKIGMIFGESEFTPGGRAMGYATSLRIRFWKKSKIKQDESVIGQKIRVECTKSKVYEPFRFAENEFYFGKGVDKWSGVFEIMERFGYIKNSGGWFKFEGEDRKWRKDDFYEFILNKDPFLQELLKQVFEVENE